ncbi:hypothetical protein [Halomonas sp. E14]|uniref:hypothetical protein n=2 Tax=unclassified Halomonas TaxID=2609666 RepID=UPI00403E84D1
MSPTSRFDPHVSRFPGMALMKLATLLALGVAFWYLASHLLRDEQAVTWAPAEAPCDLRQGPCMAELGDGVRLHFSIEAAAGIAALEPLTLSVRLEGADAEAAHVDFVGRDMNMGLHRFRLDAQSDDLFQGLAQVPICTNTTMPWQAQVVVDTERGRLGSRFDFLVERSMP